MREQVGCVIFGIFPLSVDFLEVTGLSQILNWIECCRHSGYKYFSNKLLLFSGSNLNLNVE